MRTEWDLWEFNGKQILIIIVYKNWMRLMRIEWETVKNFSCTHKTSINGIRYGQLMSIPIHIWLTFFYHIDTYIV